MRITGHAPQKHSQTFEKGICIDDSDDVLQAAQQLQHRPLGHIYNGP